MEVTLKDVQDYWQKSQPKGSGSLAWITTTGLITLCMS